VVFARRAAEHIEATAVDPAINSPENLRAYQEAQKHSGQASAAAPLDEARVAQAIERIQRTLSEQASIVKTKRGLQAALITLDAIAQEVGSDPATLPRTALAACYRNLLLNAQLVIQDALRQQHNCGTHYLIPEPSAQAQ
jgi:aspartate oxidase